MQPRRQIIGTGPYGPALAKSGDVGVGAWARRQRRRQIVRGVSGLVLLVGAFVLYVSLRPDTGSDNGSQYSVRVKCTSCGHEATIVVPVAQSFPIECPACKEQTAARLWRCAHCGNTFVPKRSGRSSVIVCPKCRSSDVGSAVEAP